MNCQIEASFHRKTCVTEAVTPRSSEKSTLSSRVDKLKVVYDVYTAKKVDLKGRQKVNFVFLHGTGMDRCIWEYYLLKLEDSNSHWTVNKALLIDQVNHGDSAVLNKSTLGSIYDWSDGARDACKIAMEELYSDNSNSMNVVVGHSMGGFQALCCPVLFPGIFQLIICIEPVVLMKSIPNPENVTKLTSGFHDALASKMLDHFKNGEDYNNYMDHKSFFVNTLPIIRNRLKEFERLDEADNTVRTKITKEQNMVTYLCLKPTADWLMSSLKHITSPVVCIYGQKSRWCPKENREFLEDNIPKYSEKIIAGGDHLLNIEIPDIVISQIRRATDQYSRNIENKAPLASVVARSTMFKKDYDKLIKQRVVYSSSKL